MAPTLPDVLAAGGGTRDHFNNYKRRGFLGDELLETTPGVARPMTQFAARKLALMIALTEVGFGVSDAAQRAEIYAARHDRKDWLIYDHQSRREIYCTNRESGARTPINKIPLQLTEDAVDQPPTRFVVVHIAGIIGRIDALFDEKGK